MKRLILFDIDGTLLSTNGGAKRAFHRAMLEVFGTAGSIAALPFDGKTDPQIARELLTGAGMTDAAVDRGLPDLWPVYLRELAAELARPGHATTRFPGVVRLLDALQANGDEFLIGLLTGNIEPGVALKLDSAGLAGRFAMGAFGSDHERRDALPAVALRRAEAISGIRFGGGDVVIIGDTPHDVTCGRALGVRAIGVASGRHGRDELRDAGAAAVLDDLSETAEAIAAILGDGT